MTQENPFGEVVYSYTRKQAIEDGVLVDLSEIATIKEHWKFPFACTATVWAIIEAALQKHGQLVLGEANLHSAISFSQKHSSFLLGFQGHCPRQAESVRTDSLLVKTMPPTTRFKLLRHF